MPRSKSRTKMRATSPALKLVSVMQALLVGEYLSFRRAASALGVRQSAVSRRVRELEDELGVSIFERHHAGVRVTNAGIRFLQEAREALLQLDHAVKAAAAAGSGTVGRLSIGILSSMATGCGRCRSALGGKDGSGTGIGGRGLGPEISPSLQVVERVDHATTDLPILRSGSVGAVLLEGAAGKAEKARSLGRAQKAWRHAGQRVGHGANLRDRANQPPDTGGGSAVTMAKKSREGGW
jgi:transposase-like protein